MWTTAAAAEATRRPVKWGKAIKTPAWRWITAWKWVPGSSFSSPAAAFHVAVGHMIYRTVDEPRESGANMLIPTFLAVVVMLRRPFAFLKIMNVPLQLASKFTSKPKTATLWTGIGGKVRHRKKEKKKKKKTTWSTAGLLNRTIRNTTITMIHNLWRNRHDNGGRRLKPRSVSHKIKR